MPNERFASDLNALLATPLEAGKPGTLGEVLLESEKLLVKGKRAAYPVWEAAIPLVRAWLREHAEDLDIILEMTAVDGQNGGYVPTRHHKPAHVPPWLLWLALCVFVHDPDHPDRASLVVAWLRRYVFRKVTWGGVVRQAFGLSTWWEGSADADHMDDGGGEVFEPDAALLEHFKDGAPYRARKKNHDDYAVPDVEWEAQHKLRRRAKVLREEDYPDDVVAYLRTAARRFRDGEYRAADCRAFLVSDVEKRRRSRSERRASGVDQLDDQDSEAREDYAADARDFEQVEELGEKGDVVEEAVEYGARAEDRAEDAERETGEDTKRGAGEDDHVEKGRILNGPVYVYKDGRHVRTEPAKVKMPRIRRRRPAPANDPNARDPNTIGHVPGLPPSPRPEDEAIPPDSEALRAVMLFVNHPETLTSHEQRVITHIRAGNTQAETARKMGCSRVAVHKTLKRLHALATAV